jgi:hypothetical protein
MLNTKVLDILRKYADEQSPSTMVLPETSQKEKFDKLEHELQLKTRTVLTDLEYDINLLKMRNFDQEMWKLLTTIWRNLEDIYLNIEKDGLFDASQQIVDYLRSKNTKAVIANLIFLADHHIKSTNVDFVPNKFMMHPKIRGISLLNHLADFAESILRQAAPSTLQSTVRPSKTNMPAVKLPPSPNVPVIEEAGE